MTDDLTSAEPHSDGPYFAEAVLVPTCWTCQERPATHRVGDRRRPNPRCPNGMQCEPCAREAAKQANEWIAEERARWLAWKEKQNAHR